MSRAVYDDGGLTGLVFLVLVFGCLACLLLQLHLRSTSKGEKSRKKQKQKERLEVEHEDLAERWMKRIEVSEADRERAKNCAQRTAQGHATKEWIYHRRFRLTASRFHRAARAVDERFSKSDRRLSCEQLVTELLTQPERNSSAKRFGIQYEKTALEAYKGHFIKRGYRPAHVRDVGLFIHPQEPWLAASPDGMVIEEETEAIGLVEIKCCRFPEQMYNVENPPAEYYDQMQGAMAVASACLGCPVSWCDFVVWSFREMRCCRIAFDPTYFNQDVLPKLRQFYFSVFVPAVAGAPKHSKERPAGNVRKLTARGKARGKR